MAGDWIKMRVDLQTHPKVVRVLSALKRDKFSVIGGLHAVWAVFDTHSTDGVLEGYTLDAMDAAIGWAGFSKAMADVHWLLETPQGLVAPEFSEHNGASAKTRATDSSRRRKSRDAEKARPDSVRDLSAKKRDKTGTREEKNINTNPPSPLAGASASVEFDALIAEFPASRRIKTDEARREFDSVVSSGEAQPAELLAAIRLQAVAQRDAWLRESGRYAPTPARWLRERRWRDGAEAGDVGQAWTQTRSGIEAMGERVGIGRWDEAAFQRGGGEAFPAYERRVRAEAEGQTAALSH